MRSVKGESVIMKARGSLSCRGGELHSPFQVERAMSTNMAKGNETRRILHRAKQTRQLPSPSFTRITLSAIVQDLLYCCLTSFFLLLELEYIYDSSIAVPFSFYEGSTTDVLFYQEMIIRLGKKKKVDVLMYTAVFSF